MTQQETLKPSPSVAIGNITVANRAPIAVFAGPCQMESRAHALDMAGALKEIAARLGIGSSTSLRTTRPTARRSAASAAWASKAR